MLLFVAAGLFVLGRLFIQHSSPAFSEEWLVQITLGLLFTIAGSISFYLQNKMLRRAEVSKALLRDHPQQPWLARDDWRQGYAESESAVLSYLYLMMGLLFLLILMPLTGKLISAIHHGQWQVIFILIFPLIGIGFLAVFVRDLRRFNRYGQSRFEFTPPISLGSHLVGNITMKGMALLNQPATVEVSCRKVVQPPGRGVASSTVYNKTYSIVWQGSCTSTGRRHNHGVALPVDIPLPYDVEESTDNTRIGFIEWVINVTSQVAGADFSGVYSIPVYRTGQSNPVLNRASLHTEEIKTRQAVIPAQFRSFTAQQTASGLQVVTRRGLAWVNSVAGIVVSLFLFGFFTFLISKFAKAMGGGVIIGGFLLIIFDSLPVVVFVASVLALFSRTYLTLGPQSLAVRKTGLIPGTRQYQYNEIKSVDIDARVGSGNTSLYYLILNIIQSGVPKKKRIMYSNRNEEIVWIEDQIEKRLKQ